MFGEVKDLGSKPSTGEVFKATTREKDLRVERGPVPTPLQGCESDT